MSSIPTTRRRVRRLRTDEYSGQSFANATYVGGFVKIEGEQMTVSEGHPFLPSKGKGTKDIGGDFYTIRRGFNDLREEIVNPQPLWRLRNPEDTQHYTGPLYAINPVTYSALTPNNRWFPPSQWPSDLSSSNSQLDALGSTAIARCEPTRSPANLSVALGELVKEGLPSMIGARSWKDRHKENVGHNAGGEYLNVQFGWLPIISEVKSLASSVVKAEELMSQYERDSGRLVRRRYEFPLDRSITVTDITPAGGADIYLANNVMYNAYTADNSGRANRKRFLEREIVRKRWFSGAFTYYLPNDYYSRGEMYKKMVFANRILGLELTPETMWELAPWSWAIDWQSNIGDVMHNVAAFANDGLVMRYGYLMEHTIIKDTYTNTGANIRGYGNRSITTTFQTEVKRRRRATPFGFGLELGALSPRQLAIMAALGLTKT